MSEVAAITAEKLSKIYYIGVRRKAVTALQDVSFEVLRGEVFAFIGLNGAGKTTTIKLLLDHARPSTGRCVLMGIDSRSPSSRNRVGYMPDVPYFYRFLNTTELLEYFGKLHGLNGSLRKERGRKLIKLVGLEGRENEPLKGFSRGMLQRVGLAQALMSDPDLLILDEPLGGLDPVGRFEFHSIIMALKNEGKTIFFSSHILEDAAKVADRVGIVHNGRMVTVGSLKELVGSRSGFDIELGIPAESPVVSSLVGSHAWKVSAVKDGVSISVGNEDEVQELMRRSLEDNLSIRSINPSARSLEEVFLSELQKWKV